MAARSLTERVEILEQQVEDLRELPDRVAAVESQILQLRGEIQGEFSAIRERFDDTQRYMRVLHEDVLARLALLQEGLGKRKKR